SCPHNDGGAGHYGGRDSVYGDLSWGGHASRRIFSGIPLPDQNVNRKTIKALTAKPYTILRTTRGRLGLALCLHLRVTPSDDIRYAILCHAPYHGYERKTLMDKAILAVDELVGFITAVALVQPSKRVAAVKVSSVQKKLKDKAFARSVNREDIYLGVADLGITLEDHIVLT